MNPPTQQQKSVPASLPLLVAISAGLIQLASCGTPLVSIGVPVGFAVGVADIVWGHITLARIKRDALPGGSLVRFGLVAGYLSLLTIPIVGCGILLVVFRGGGH